VTKMIPAQRTGIAQAKRQPEIDGSSLRVRGTGAYILLIAILALLAVGTFHLAPVWGIVLSGTFWLAFSVYWGSAA
jgi:hypothetical protein